MSEKRLIDDELDEPIRERLQALADFLPAFEREGFAFGERPPSFKNKDGVFVLSRYELSATAVSFLRIAYDHGWVLTGFAWPAWKGTPEAIKMRDDPEILAAATPTQLAKLLTVLIRQDRFVEGGWWGRV